MSFLNSLLKLQVVLYCVISTIKIFFSNETCGMGIQRNRFNKKGKIKRVFGKEEKKRGGEAFKTRKAKGREAQKGRKARCAASDSVVF